MIPDSCFIKCFLLGWPDCYYIWLLPATTVDFSVSSRLSECIMLNAVPYPNPETLLKLPGMNFGTDILGLCPFISRFKTCDALWKLPWEFKFIGEVLFFGVLPPLLWPLLLLSVDKILYLSNSFSGGGHFPTINIGLNSPSGPVSKTSNYCSWSCMYYSIISWYYSGVNSGSNSEFLRLFCECSPLM